MPTQQSSIRQRLVGTGVAALVLTAPAFAANDGVACSPTDISPGAMSCEGFFTGNVINNSPADLATASSALDDLVGLSGATGAWVEKQDFSGDAITFSTPLTGMTIVGIHFGKALGANPPGVDLQGGGTAFYKFDAGAGLASNSFTVNVGGLSNAALYATNGNPVPGIPEPETYALMLAGLGTLGFIARRRKQ